MPTQTTNYNFNKPNVNSADDEDLWGDQLNDNWDSVDGVIFGLIPAGLISDFGGTTAPSGWLLCDGSAVSRTTYSILFTAIGTTFGAGDGSTTFNVPDLRGRVAAGKDDMGGSAASRLTNGVSGVDGATLGASGGDENSQQHNHAVTDPGHTHGMTASGDPAVNSSAGGSTVSGRSLTHAGGTAPQNLTDSATTGITLADSGSGSSENVQPTLVLNKIIKT